jgi:ATP-dependent Zn protease
MLEASRGAWPQPAIEVQVMVISNPIPTESESTAVHEAGHAVLQIALGVGLKSITIVPDHDSAGATLVGGEYGEPAQAHGEEDDDVAQLRFWAEDAFVFRRATALDDFEKAAQRKNEVTADAQSINLYFKLAKRRWHELVKHYAPEIEALAAELLSRKTLTGEEASTLFSDS